MKISTAILVPALVTATIAITFEAGAGVDARGWLEWSQDSRNVLVSGRGRPVNVQVNDNWFLGDAEDVTSSQETSAAGGVLVHYVKDTGKLSWRHTPFPALGDYAWLRTAVYENTSDTTQDITGARMYAALNLPDAPLEWNPRPFYMARCADDLLAALAYKGTTEHYNFHRRDGAVGHDVHACWRLAPGESATIEAQAVWVRKVEGGASLDDREWGEAFRAEAQRWYDAIGLHVPADMPEWARHMLLYEYNAGGHIDSRFSDVGGFRQLAKQTDYLAALGITAVWLQAVHEHKMPPNPVEGGWNLYDPRDVLAVDTIMGGDDGLRELCGSLREAGIHILGESVPHGGHSVQGKTMPEWWSYERDGSPRRNWGGCGMDYASPEWQRVMASSMTWQAREFGFAGCRVDVADGSGPNWKSPRTNHASYSTLGGAVELLGALRDAMSAYVDYPILIPEAFDQVEYFRITPVGYGHDFWMFVLNEAQPLVNDPAAMAEAFRVFLERERGSLPRGALTLRTLNNHDTVCEAGRAHHRFGVGLARALHGLCLMIPGIPMLYQEQEIGDWFALRDMHRARRGIPEFTGDNVDYYAVAFAPEVFTCLRGTIADGLAIGFSNLSGKEVNGNARISSWIDIPDGTLLYDGITGKTTPVSDNSFSWTLAPYQTALIRVGKSPEPVPMPNYNDPPAATKTKAPIITAPELNLEMGDFFFTWGNMRIDIQAGGQEWRLGADDGEGRTYMNDIAEMRMSEVGEGLQCELVFGHAATEDWPAIVVKDARTWQVSGRTAILHDHVLRRHYPWPENSGYVWDKYMRWVGYDIYNQISPTGRLWESVIEPLHPDASAIEFHDVCDNRLLIHNIKTNAGNLLLRDGVEGNDYVLRLELRGLDSELVPHVATVGIGQPYSLEYQHPDRSDGYTATFMITALAGAISEVERHIADTPRLPSDRHVYRMAVTGKGAQINHRLGAVFPEPGTAAWVGLALPDGYYRLKFTMRHSEISAAGTDLDSAYTILVNGEPLSYTWRGKNVFRHENAYYGHAVTAPCYFQGRDHKITISTALPWCMIKERFVLIQED